MRTERALLWRRIDEVGFEWCNAVLEGDRLSAHGVQVGVTPEQYRLDYRIDTHPGFVTRSLHARVEGAGWSRRLDLHRESDGRWHTANAAIDDVNGAADVDLGFSPLTNTLPVLRLGTAGGEIVVAWVRVPELTVEPMQQRYDNRRVGSAVFSTGAFSTELSLDGDGFVRHYPDLATLVVN